MDSLQKKKKQLDKFTYDYEGDFFGSKLSNPENTLGRAAKILSEFSKDTPNNKKKLEKYKPLFTTLVNDKL